MRPRNFRILLVDDSPSDVRLVAEGLRMAQVPVEIHVACDGARALESMRKMQRANQRPDLVVLDLNMPGKNGHQVLAEMQSSACLRGIPVMVLSSSNSEDDRRTAYELNACCFVTKPNNLPEYVEMARGMDKFVLSGLALRPCPL